jgi:TRAP-type transport system periplasmic protein
VTARWRKQRRFVTVAVACLSTIVAAGCKSGSIESKAGGPGEPVVLRLANTSAFLDYSPEVQYFVDRVEKLSSGNVRILVLNRWANSAPNSEQQLIRDVRNGTADLGRTDPLDLAEAGAVAFRALRAPMLVDSYPLQQAMIEGGLASEMLRGSDAAGVMGLALLAGNSQKPIATGKPLLGPAEYRGITFYTYLSEGYTAGVRALGAIPIDDRALAADPTAGGLDGGVRKGRIRGFAKGLVAYAINGQQRIAPYVTLNVNLWSGMALLLANPRRFERLSPSQQAWLREAATDAAANSVTILDNEGRRIENLCDAGARFANASDADLFALRRAFDPVYTALERDATIKTLIEKIERLRRSIVPSPARIPSGCAWSASRAAGS